MSEEEKDIFCKDFWDGKPEAFKEFVERFGQRIFRICFTVLYDCKQNAEDAAQNAFLRIYQNLGKFRKKSTPFTWIYRIAKNCAYNELKKKRKKKGKMDIFIEEEVMEGRDKESFLERVPDRNYNPSEEEEKRHREEFIRKKVEELPKKYREIIFYVYFEGLKIKEVSEILKCPINTVKVRLFRAHKMLREKLERSDEYKKM